MTDDKQDRRRIKLLKGVQRWALSRNGMADPATRPKLEDLAAKAGESIERRSATKKDRPE